MDGGDGSYRGLPLLCLLLYSPSAPYMNLANQLRRNGVTIKGANGEVRWKEKEGKWRGVRCVFWVVTACHSEKCFGRSPNYTALQYRRYDLENLTLSFGRFLLSIISGHCQMGSLTLSLRHITFCLRLHGLRLRQTESDVVLLRHGFVHQIL